MVFAFIPLYHALLHLFPAFREFLRIENDPDLAIEGDWDEEGHDEQDGYVDVYAYDPKPISGPAPVMLDGKRTLSRTKEVYVFPEASPGKGPGEEEGMWVIVEDWD